uniref:response regulator n=1 Tax=Flavobacterium sp. TaxID=239 RepID=UPI00404A23AD
MSQAISVVVADDHPLLLQSLVDTMHSFGFHVVGKATNGLEALNLIIKDKPTLALLDFQMPIMTGLEVVQKTNEIKSETKIVLLTSYKEKALVKKALELKIAGYILKDEHINEILKGINIILKGETYFSQSLNEIVEVTLKQEQFKINLLTPSERTILRLISKDLHSKEIGEKLSISIRTVQKHRSNIILKLDLPAGVDPLQTWIKQNEELIEDL